MAMRFNAHKLDVAELKLINYNGSEIIVGSASIWQQLHLLAPFLKKKETEISLIG